MNTDLLWRWLHAPLFTVSSTSVTTSTLLGLVTLLVGAWWWATDRIEASIRRPGRGHPRRAISIYAWARVVR